jgi:hypothetical protein
MVLSLKKLTTPYGGSLVNLLIQSSQREELLEKNISYPFEDFAN